GSNSFMHTCLRSRRQRWDNCNQTVLEGLAPKRTEGQDHGLSAPVPGQSISGVDRLLAIAECERLMYQYAYRLDHGIGHTVAELFTEDGEWTSPAIRSTGRDGLAA